MFLFHIFMYNGQKCSVHVFCCNGIDLKLSRSHSNEGCELLPAGFNVHFLFTYFVIVFSLSQVFLWLLNIILKRICLNLTDFKKGRGNSTAFTFKLRDHIYICKPIGGTSATLDLTLKLEEIDDVDCFKMEGFFF